MGLIKLQTSDRKVFEVNRELVRSIEAIEAMVENLGEDELGDKAITLKEVDSACFGKIMQWLLYMHHSGNVTPVEMALYKTKFVDDNQDIIFELIHAANFLGIKDLMAILCQNVASQFENKGTHEICDKFAITEN